MVLGLPLSVALAFVTYGLLAKRKADDIKEMLLNVGIFFGALGAGVLLAVLLGLLSVLAITSGALAALVSRLTGSFPVDFKLDISAPSSDS